MRTSIACALTGALILTAAPARADVLTVWAAAKGVVTGGTADIFVNYEGTVAGGVEAGVELFGIDLYGEALLLAPDQYFLTANLGIDLSFGDSLRLDVGGFTGPMFFVFPEDGSAPPTGLQLDNLTAQEQEALRIGAMAAGYNSLDELNAAFAEQSMLEEDLNRLDVGWNIVRARARYVRSAPRKARLVMDHIRGKRVEQAQAILTHAPRAAAGDILKLLNSAVANAESAYELGPDELTVRRAYVDEGPTIKRFRPRALGRATRISKRTSHMTIELTTEGNGR